MSLEQKINQELNKHPGIKKGMKRIYQRAMFAISPKIKSEGDIERISPDDPKHEYFFGYYDKSPEDATGRYVLCLKAEDTWSDVAPTTPAQILLIDTSKSESDPERVKQIAVTRTWNVQQGCMMQWLGPDFDREIIYNDFRDGKYCSVVLDVFNGSESVLAMPVYSVAADGSFALTLDFSRLHRLRPGYGYSNLPEETRDQKIPDSTAIWKLDISSNTVSPVLPYTAFSAFEPRKEMAGAEHKVNHIMLSPSGKRFMVLHRWFDGKRKYTRLVTVNVDGSEIYNLSDDDMVSHCYWKNDEEIIAFENKKGQGAGYYLMKDRSPSYKHLWPAMAADGHPSYSPDRSLVVTDTYPNRSRIACLRTMAGNDVAIIAKVFAPFKYDNDTRCDLHPRWSRDGKKVYFDSVFEGHRGLYAVQAQSDSGEQIKPADLNSYKPSTVSKIKSGLRRAAKGTLRFVVRDGKMQKQLTMTAYNLKARTGKKQKKLPDIFNYQAIIDGPTIFAANEYYRGNSYYGIGQKLREYSGYKKPINACSEHGVYFGDYTDEKEMVNSGLNGLITFSAHRKAFLDDKADVPVYAIGPYIHYAHVLLSDEELKAKKAELGKTLLFFPDHSVDRVDTDFDTASLIAELKIFAKENGFKTVMVSLFYKDVQLGRAKEYEEEGFIVVTNGYRMDPHFLDRQKTFISLADYTASNAVGTHIGYCVALGKGHLIFDQDIKYNAYSQAEMAAVPEASNDLVKRDRNEVKKCFTSYSPVITDDQRRIVDKFWGLSCVKNPTEMLEILTSLEKKK